jgi:DNA-binding GntR family transcriptional regulator
MNRDDPDTIPNRLYSKLLERGHPLMITEICLLFPDVSRTSINRALTKLEERGMVEFLGRSTGWRAKKRS